MKKELKLKRAKLVKYCMDNPSLTLDADYLKESQRLDWHRKNVVTMTEAEIDDELKHIDEMEVKK